MDDIELLIRDAWKKIKPKLLPDSQELKRRLDRSRQASLSRPPRAWCVAIRASDRRLEEYGYENVNSRQYAVGSRQKDEHGVGPVSKMTNTAYGLPPTAYTQQVFLDSHLLRDLCSAVRIERGGDSWDAVARQLGTGFRGLQAARVSGRLGARYVEHLCGRPGTAVPILCSDQELDPGARGFIAADAAWGWTAQYLVNHIPDDFLAELSRVPVYRSPVAAGQFDETEHPEVHQSRRCKPTPRLPPAPSDYVWYKWSKSGEYLGDDPRYWRKHASDPGMPPPAGTIARNKKRTRHPRPSVSSGSVQFRGWMWVCPKCEKRVRTIYLPVMRMRLLRDSFIDHLAEGRGDLETGEEGEMVCDGADMFCPLVSPSPSPPVSVSSFACYTCHRIRSFSRIDSKNSWNELVSYLSGGLLYGREVERPDWYVGEAARKREYRPRPRWAPRRQQVLRRMLNGWTITQIATDLKMVKQQVSDCIRKLCRQENVANRRELAEKLGSPHFQPLDRDRWQPPAHEKAGVNPAVSFE